MFTINTIMLNLTYYNNNTDEYRLHTYSFTFKKFS